MRKSKLELAQKMRQQFFANRKIWCGYKIRFYKFKIKAV